MFPSNRCPEVMCVIQQNLPSNSPIFPSVVSPSAAKATSTPTPRARIEYNHRYFLDPFPPAISLKYGRIWGCHFRGNSRGLPNCY